jgi:hypothetical protein
MVERTRSLFLGREFTVGVRVGTAITVVVGFVFVFLGGSVDDRPAPIPSFSLWLGTLLAAELSALLIAWGGLAIYFDASRPGPPAPTHMSLVLGLLVGALGGGLFVAALLLNRWGSPISHRRHDMTQPGSMLGQPDDRERRLAAHDQVARTLDRILRIFLGLVALAAFTGAVVILLDMSRTSAGLGARLAVAVATVLLLGWLDTQFGWLAERRRPFWMTGPGETEYRRYAIRSSVLLVLAALILVGLALFLP